MLKVVTLGHPARVCSPGVPPTCNCCSSFSWALVFLGLIYASISEEAYLGDLGEEEAEQQNQMVMDLNHFHRV